jgi:hypothetical protein
MRRRLVIAGAILAAAAAAVWLIYRGIPEAAARLLSPF